MCRELLFPDCTVNSLGSPRGGEHNRTHAPLPAQLVEQSRGVPQPGHIEVLGGPAADRHEEVDGLITLALVAPEPGEASRGAHFPRSRAPSAMSQVSEEGTPSLALQVQLAS